MNLHLLHNFPLYKHRLTHLSTVHVCVTHSWGSIRFEQHHINESDED
jgi:hypothetical protein